MAYELPVLPYAYDALEPHLDKATLEFHHDKHHKGYVDGLNATLGKLDEARKSGDMALVQHYERLVGFHGAGHQNHVQYWENMAPAGKGGGGEPTGEVATAINAAYGTFAHFKEEFAKAGAGRFGSGWAWLCAKQDGSGVQICSTANQDNPLMGEKIAGCGGRPILGLDVWEHAYYLNYQNRRPDYMAAWWNVVNWDQVAKNFAAK